MKLLVVEDDRDQVELLVFSLERAEFDVVTAFDARGALQAFEASAPDLVLLDINLGTGNGLSVLRELRRHSDVPVVLLTARAQEDDKVLGFELGADDYVTKPFSHRELIARIRAVLRRRGAATPLPAVATASVQQVGSLTLNAAEHSAALDGRPLNLTVTEFRLLQTLLGEAGSVVSTATLLRSVWGYEDPAGTDVVRVTVHRLRRKLESDPSRPRLLHTVPRVGFMLKPEPLETPLRQ